MTTISVTEGLLSQEWVSAKVHLSPVYDSACASVKGGNEYSSVGAGGGGNISGAMGMVLIRMRGR